MESMKIDEARLNTPEHQIMMARIFLHEARKAKFRDWGFTLLNWAGERRRKAMELKKIGPPQRELF
jgi:hypothetical protein